MYDTAKALYTFFSSFGLRAFVQGNVPEYIFDPDQGKEIPVELPYITYELREPAPGHECHLMAHIWYRDNSYEAITKKVDEVKAFIGSGVSIHVDGGAVHLWPEDRNFVQFPPAEDPEIKDAFLQFVMGAYKS